MSEHIDYLDNIFYEILNDLEFTPKKELPKSFILDFVDLREKIAKVYTEKPAQFRQDLKQTEVYKDIIKPNYHFRTMPYQEGGFQMTFRRK